MSDADVPGEVARTVEDLQVFQRALAGARAISEMLERQSFQRDRDLASQLGRASVRVVSDIAEGFRQKSDRHFARYLFDARGGADEIRAQLLIAVIRKHMSDDECSRLSEQFNEIGRMLTGLIRYLQREDWKDRRR